MELSHLEQLLILAARYGVVKLKTPEIELELGPSAQSIVQSTQSLTPEKQEISDEDMLFWSVPIASPNGTAEVAPTFTIKE